LIHYFRSQTFLLRFEKYFKIFAFFEVATRNLFEPTVLQARSNQADNEVCEQSERPTNAAKCLASTEKSSNLSNDVHMTSF